MRGIAISDRLAVLQPVSFCIFCTIFWVRSEDSAYYICVYIVAMWLCKFQAVSLHDILYYICLTGLANQGLTIPCFKPQTANATVNTIEWVERTSTRSQNCVTEQRLTMGCEYKTKNPNVKGFQTHNSGYLRRCDIFVLYECDKGQK